MTNKNYLYKIQPPKKRTRKAPVESKKKNSNESKKIVSQQKKSVDEVASTPKASDTIEPAGTTLKKNSLVATATSHFDNSAEIFESVAVESGNAGISYKREVVSYANHHKQRT